MDYEETFSFMGFDALKYYNKIFMLTYYRENYESLTDRLTEIERHLHKKLTNWRTYLQSELYSRFAIMNKTLANCRIDLYATKKLETINYKLCNKKVQNVILCLKWKACCFLRCEYDGSNIFVKISKESVSKFLYEWLWELKASGVFFSNNLQL